MFYGKLFHVFSQPSTRNDNGWFCSADEVGLSPSRVEGFLPSSVVMGNHPIGAGASPTSFSARAKKRINVSGADKGVTGGK